MTRFFGFHRVSPHRDQKHYFVVMGNIFAQNLEIVTRFDLKVSSVVCCCVVLCCVVVLYDLTEEL